MSLIFKLNTVIKKLFYIILFINITVSAQTKYLTKTGTINFEASMTSLEEVKATNKSVTAILNTENGQFAALVFVKGFRFKNALMEEHFNENYAESDTYPKATFKGNIKDFDLNAINPNKSLTLDGTLTFHGKSKAVNGVILNISKNENNTISLTGNFDILVSDFDIKIPKIVSDKVSEEVHVSFQFDLKKQ